MEEIKVYEAGQAMAVVSGKNYVVKTPFGGQTKLIRDVDFGVVPRTKQPSLLKSGAEKICMAYGLLQRYSVESKIEDVERPLFYYLFRCDLIKIGADGKEYVFASGFGSANTSEKRNGFNGAFDASNSTVKMAQKRALVHAAIAISGLSSMFTQDMENENFMAQADDALAAAKDDAPITPKQMKRVFALAANIGIPANEAKQKIIAAGYASTKDIKQKDYDAVCALFPQE